MEEETRNPVETTESPAPTHDFFGAPKEKKSNVAVPIAIVVILLLLVGGVFFFVKSRTASVEPSPSPNVETPVITEQTPSPSPSVSKESIKIKILNGTGTAGEAALLKDKLSSAGYTNVEAGNASRQDYTDSQVAFDSDVPQSVRDEIASVLKSTYKGVKETSGVGTGFDVEIITGLRIGVTPKPSATPTSSPKASGSPSPSPSPTKTATPTPTATP